MPTRSPLLLLALLTLPACSDSGDSRGADAWDLREQQVRQKAEATEREKVGEIEANVRLRTLQAQVYALQQEVGELKNTRQSLELDLIKQRLTALEARQAAAPGQAPTATPTPRATAKPAPTKAD